MIVIFSSLFVLLQVILIVQVLRFIAKLLISEAVFTVVDEFLAFTQLSCCILELGVISKTYGFQSVCAILATFIFLTVKHIVFFKGEYVGSPVTYLEHFYRGSRKVTFSFTSALVIIAAELSGSLLAHPILRLLWGKSFSAFHNQEAFIECRSTLHVSFLTGFVVEILTSFVSLGSDLLTPFRMKPPVRALTTIILAQLFHKTSGVWMNPVLASAHTFQCVGHGSTCEHLLVYWLGPFLGAALVYEVKEIIEMFHDRNVCLSEVKKPSDEVVSPEQTNPKEASLFDFFVWGGILKDDHKDEFELAEKNHNNVERKYTRRRRKAVKKNRGW